MEEPALEGIKVVEFAQMIAGPSAGFLLAEYGAEVIKVEPPEGDSCRQLKSPVALSLRDSPVFLTYNRGKRLTRIDLQTADGHREALQLIDHADVVIEASRPGVMEKLGLGAEALMARRPTLIYASVSGFGNGPIGRTLGGVDIIVQAESGLMSTTGYADRPPTKVGFTVIDAACGHALCHGILAALFRRTRTGKGDVVRISLYDLSLHLQSGPLTEFLMTGEQLPRAGNSALLSAPADLFKCAGGDVVITAYLDAHWRRFAAVIGAPELLQDHRFETGASRARNRQELTVLIEEQLARKTAGEWVSLLRAEGLLAGAVKSYKQVIADPLSAESGIIKADGIEFGISNPVRMERTRSRGLQSRPVAEPESGSLRFHGDEQGIGR